MHITFVTRRYWPAIGGVESVAMNLGESLHTQGHRISVVAQCVDEQRFGRMTHIIRENSRFAPFVHNGVRVEQFRPSRRRRILLLPFGLELVPLAGRISQRWLRRYTAGYYTAVVKHVLAPLMVGADIVHVLGGEVLAVAAVETARRLGIPVVISPFAHPGEWGFDSASIRAYQHADAVIATTAADASIYAGVGVTRDRLHVVGLPVPEMHMPHNAKERSGIAEGPLVLFLGGRRPNKGVDILLRAAPLVWDRHPETRFAFVGPGDPLPTHDPRLLDVGRVSDAERALWLSRATVLCLPSASESFGLVVPEAWSHGVPVVVSNIPVLEELVEASGGGLVAPRDPGALAAAIDSLLEDPDRALALGDSGREYWRAHLAPLAVAEQHVAIYERLRLGNAASRRGAAVVYTQPG